jgi:hypothetical protein
MRTYLARFVVASTAFAVCGAACSSSPKGASSSSHGPDAATTSSSFEPGPPGPSPEGGTQPTVTQASGVAFPGTALPELTNVLAVERPDSVGIDFDPVDDAVDYRVYPLPANQSDITVNSDGSLTIPKAVYRCAGLRQTWDLPNDLDMGTKGLALANPNGTWTVKVGASPIVGNVYVTPGDGRVPVYALGGWSAGNEFGWRESRLKIYTTDDTERQTLLSQNWRDDGIAFYVPSAASSTTQTIYTSEVILTWPGFPYHERYYFTPADVSMHMGDTTPPAPAFQVLTAAGTDTKPLYAVLYQPSFSTHTELSAGKERFHRSAYQGGSGALWHLEWAGMTQPTTLVIEALASGCPYQGFLAAQHLDGNVSGITPESLGHPPHQTFYTLSELQAASSTGEVYVNGQYDTATAPKPVARSFVQVSPQPPGSGDWDWYKGFETDLGTSTKMPTCLEAGTTGYNCVHFQTTDFDIGGYRLDEPPSGPAFVYGTFLGQLWVAFDDAGQDVTGKVRFTALQTTTVSSDPNKYLHVTMSVNMLTGLRRYPQLIISDQPVPVQEGLSNPNNNTLLIQPITGPSMRIEAQAIHGLVNKIQWDVNNQSPSHTFAPSGNSDNQNDTPLTPAEPPFEHSGVDRLTRFDAFISSQRVYLFMDGGPTGCMQYPTGSPFTLSGATVTMTVGDVLYHEGAPDEVCGSHEMFPFSNEHNCLETDRHFDDLGFKAGVSAPGTSGFVVGASAWSWDETRIPCKAY